MHARNLMLVPGLLALMSSEALAQAPVPAPPAPAPAAPAPAAPAPAAPAPAAPAPAPPAEAAPPPAAPAAAAPVEAAPPPAPAPAPVPAAPAPAVQGPTQLSTGKQGFFQPSILFQFWAFLQNQDNDAPPPNTSDTFRVRRAEFRAKGEIIPKTIGYYLMIDPARVLDVDAAPVAVTNGAPADPAEPAPSVTVFQPANGVVSAFQDLMIQFLSEYSDVSLGQFKIPVSWEGVNSSAKLLFPERSLVSRRYGDRRDVGAKAEKKLFDDKFYYYAGIFNGNGQNRVDNNLQKDAALRLEVYPIEGLMVGGVGYTALGQRTQPNTKDRVEADLNFEMSNFLIRTEYIHAWDMNAAGTDRVEGNGLAAVTGYTFADTIQPVFRFGILDPGAGTDGVGTADEVFSYELGANYYILGQEAKAQLQLGLFDFDDAPTQYQATLAAQVHY